MNDVSIIPDLTPSLHKPATGKSRRAGGSREARGA